MTEITPRDRRYMQEAIDLSIDNIDMGGGPFGAVIVDAEGNRVSTGVNTVTRDCDPTAHAEVNAVRAASRKLGSFKLTGCTVYSSCEPCPMCLSALYWAGVARLFYGNTKADAKAIDFDDSFIYEQLELPPSERAIPSHQLMHAEALKAFEKWDRSTDKTPY